MCQLILTKSKEDFKTKDDGIVNNKKEQIQMLVATAINRAYRDAASHVLKTDGKNESVRSIGAKFLLENINIEELENAYSLIEGLQDKITSETEAGEEEFTIGISQKWVNMTYKYIYLLNKLIFTESLISEEKFQNIYEIPIDRYIISAAKLQNKSWSVYDKDTYENAKKKISDELNKDNKIKWENRKWMENAIKSSDSTYNRRIKTIIDSISKEE